MKAFILELVDLVNGFRSARAFVAVRRTALRSPDKGRACGLNISASFTCPRIQSRERITPGPYSVKIRFHWRAHDQVY